MASNQPEKVFRICPKSTIQNGKPKFPEVCTAERDTLCELDLKDAYSMFHCIKALRYHFGLYGQGNYTSSYAFEMVLFKGQEDLPK